MSDQRRKALFVDVTEDFHRQVRVAAIGSGKTVRQWVTEAVLAKMAGVGKCPRDEGNAPAGE